MSDVVGRRAPQVTVIAPVFNHWTLVPDLLAALHAQSLPSETFELLLVDNGSAHVPDLALPHWARLLHCASPGSYSARNLALGEARGDILAFTDADCRPEPDWLAQGLACMAGSKDRCLVAGDIRLEPRDPVRPTPYEIYDMALGMPQRRYVDRGYAITANLFVPRVIVDAVGPFDAKRFSGGDAEFCRRARAAGFGLVFCAASRIRHPARSEWRELVTKARRIKGGQIAAGSPGRRLSYALRTLIPPVHVWKIALRARPFTLRQRLLVCAIKTRLWGVEIAEMLRLLFGGRASRE